MAHHYDVIFEGETVPGKDLASVKERLKEVLKVETAVIERLFAENPVIIRRDVNTETAENFRKAFEYAGAICTLKPMIPQSGNGNGNGEDIKVSGSDKHDRPTGTPVSSRTIKTANGGEMIVTNIESVPGKMIVEHFGLVSGSTIRAKHVGRDIMAGLKNLVGGELKGYTQLLQESRRQAMDRMIEEAQQLGANAIINVRFSTSSVAQGAAELYAYGTAVNVVD